MAQEGHQTFTEALLAGSLKSLSHTFRYATFPMLKAENVAEHSFWVSIYALALYYKMGEALHEWWDQTICKATLLEMALTHDLEERISGDIVKNFKDGNPELAKLLDAQAIEGSLEVFQMENFTDKFVEGTLLHRKRDLSWEAKIVSLADTMCVGSKLLGEAEMGNAHARSLLLKLFVPGMARAGALGVTLARSQHNRALTNEELISMHISNFYGEMGLVIERRLRNPHEDNHYLGVWRQEEST